MAYRTVHERFWRDPKVLGLSSKNKLLFLYLITSADAHYSGVYYCPLQIMQLETGLSEKDVREGIDTLSKGYMVEYDNATNEVFVLNMAKFQVTSAQQIKGVSNHFKETIQSQTLIQSFMERYNTLSIPYDIPYRIPIDTTETETETDRETDRDRDRDRDRDTKKKPTKILVAQKPDDVSQQIWDEWQLIKKGKGQTMTVGAFDKFVERAKRFGFTTQSLIEYCIDRSWASATDEYLKNNGFKPVCEKEPELEFVEAQ